MAIKTVQEESLTAIGDAIRSRTGGTEALEFPDGMVEAIDGMMALPESALTLTGSQESAFANNCWNWFIETYGSQIKTENITQTKQMFYSASLLTDIPFDLNIKIFNNKTLVNEKTFASCSKLKRYPNIYLSASKPTTALLDQCYNVEPNIFLDENVILIGVQYDAMDNWPHAVEPTWLFNKIDWDKGRQETTIFGSPFPIKWTNCYYIKTIPSMPLFYNDATSSYYNHWYYFNLSNCYNLQTITLPRPGSVILSSTPSGFTTSGLYSLKHFVFDTQPSGAPFTAKWNKITLSLVQAGWSSSVYTHYYNPDKQVSDEITYALLKNDDEYWTWDQAYACYNHDSAVETINSLPDCSAYGTNTIKFQGKSGSKTDGGAINTLTAEEIAVATAKGWTVSLV